MKIPQGGGSCRGGRGLNTFFGFRNAHQGTIGRAILNLSGIESPFFPGLWDFSDNAKSRSSEFALIENTGVSPDIAPEIPSDKNITYKESKRMEIIRSEQLQNESCPDFSDFRPEFCPEFAPNFLRIF